MHVALARKWRPQRFEDVIGQRGTVDTLRNAITSGRLAQSFIFAGPSGVEFAQPINEPAANLPNDTPIQRALPHLIPGVNAPLPELTSPFVEGLIGKLKLVRDGAAGTASKLTGTISKPGLLGKDITCF